MHKYSFEKMMTQVDSVKMKVIGMLTFNIQGVEYRSWVILLQLCKILLRSHLE